MVWNTIAHPKMMADSASNGIMRPIKYVDTAKQSVYDMIISVYYSGSGKPTFVLVHGDYETIYRMLMNDEFIRVAMVWVATADGEKTQIYTATVGHNISVASNIGTVNGKPVVEIRVTASDGPNNFFQRIFFLASNNVLYDDPKLIPVDNKQTK